MAEGTHNSQEEPHGDSSNDGTSFFSLTKTSSSEQPSQQSVMNFEGKIGAGLISQQNQNQQVISQRTFNFCPQAQQPTFRPSSALEDPFLKHNASTDSSSSALYLCPQPFSSPFSENSVEFVPSESF